METKSNRTIVLECYRKIIRDLDLSLVDEYVKEDYIQHSPTVKDGKAGLLEMLTFLKSLPQPKEHGPSPIIRTITEGDLVAVHLDVQFMGKRIAVVDLFRLQDSKLAEHWDAGQEQHAQDGDLITMTNGTATINETANPSTNKSLITEFYTVLGIGGKDTVTDKYMNDTYTDHDPDNGLLKYQYSGIKVHRLVAEGDFVVAQWECVRLSNVFARYDIFRVEHNKISEHWSVEQKMPLTMAHNNGMF